MTKNEQERKSTGSQAGNPAAMSDPADAGIAGSAGNVGDVGGGSSASEAGGGSRDGTSGSGTGSGSAGARSSASTSSAAGSEVGGEMSASGEGSSGDGSAQGSTGSPGDGGGAMARTRSTDQAGGNVAARTGFLVPPVDVIEDASGITLMADMPGVSKDKLDLRLETSSLTISGEVSLDVPQGMDSRYAEVRHQQYQRTFALSKELDGEQASAELTHGVLKIRIPKTAHAQPRRVQINVA